MTQQNVLTVNGIYYGIDLLKFYHFFNIWNSTLCMQQWRFGLILMVNRSDCSRRNVAAIPMTSSPGVTRFRLGSVVGVRTTSWVFQMQINASVVNKCSICTRDVFWWTNHISFFLKIITWGHLSQCLELSPLDCETQNESLFFIWITMFQVFFLNLIRFFLCLKFELNPLMFFFRV